MGHGKETPRQKMIGMMYLVLTALLAMNVSKDVLDAFVIVDEGITKTTENFYLKNDMLYQAFQQAATENEEKAGKWRDMAFEVKERSDKLYEYIQELKVEIVETSEGPESEALQEGKIIGENIQGKDNTDVPAQIMIGSNDDGKANDLRAALEGYEEYLLSLLPANAETTTESIKKSLDTENPPAKEGQQTTWQHEHFQGLPLIGVVTLMSGLQADVRNAESEVLRYLYSMIDAGSFKFNKLEAQVIHSSSYVLRGNPYTAEVFISAFDSTQQPVVYVGRYDSVQREDGSWDYDMTGNYDSLPVDGGKGIYDIRPSSLGYQEWGGLIKLKSPSGGADIKKPFRMQYQVAEPSLVVSPTKMNVFYLGVPNPVEISVPGVPADKIYPSITNGNISKSGGSYVVKPTRPGTSLITVMAEVEGERKNVGYKEFRVKVVPNPVPKVAGMSGGDINKGVLAAQAGVIAEMENFDFDLNFRVTEFMVSTSQNGFVREAGANGNRFSGEQKGIINNATKGQRIYIQDIKAVGPDGSVRDLPTIAFRVN